MGDTITDDGAAVATDEGSEAEAAEQKTATADGGEDSSTGESGTAKDGTAPSQKASNDTSDEAPTRKPRTNADWVALRRQQKLEREQRKARESKGEEDGADDEDDDVSPEDAKIIDRRVQRHIQPILEQQAEASVKSEIADFIDQNPDFKPYAEKAAKWAKHPSWQDVPTEQLMYAVAGRDLLRIGAERRDAAENKARHTKTAGSSAASASSKKAVADMTDEEFAKEVERVKLGK